MRRIPYLWHLSFLIAGALFFLACLRWCEYISYRHTSSGEFLHSTRMIVSVAVIGAVSVWFFFANFARQILEEPPGLFRRCVVRGGLYGLSATFAGIQGLFALLALYSALMVPTAYPGHPIARLELSFVSIQTYGGGTIIETAPVAFALGALAGAVLYTLRRGKPTLPVEIPKSVRLTRAALATAILGLFFGFAIFPFPIPGGVFSVLALVFGSRAINQQKLSAEIPGRAPRVAVILGCIGVIGAVFGPIAAGLYFKMRH